MQLKGDSYIGYDDVIPQVLQEQRRARDMGHIHNEVCLEYETLREVLNQIYQQECMKKHILFLLDKVMKV